MHRTKILCPECFIKKLLTENKNEEIDSDAYCDNCGTHFTIIDENTVKYK